VVFSCPKSYPLSVCLLVLAACMGILAPGSLAQQSAKRLILKDGSYQLTVKWEVKGDRVRYLSAERNEWEEVPKSMVDWEATDKYEKDRAAGAPPPEVVELDKELAAERRTDEAKSPHVAPGLRLPDAGGVVLLDTFQGQPQLVELQPSSGQINADRKGNILRATINPVASAKQPIVLAGEHAKLQAHAPLPAVYISVEQSDLGPDAGSPIQQEGLPWDRFRIVRLQAKQNKRIVGDVKVAVYGKVSQEEKLVPTSSARLTGGWMKLTPASELAPGEYAVVEMLGKEGMNLNVWDFGINPSAPSNPAAVKPDPSETNPPAEPPKLQTRPPQPN
jgi:hypothetical protein